MRDRKSLTKSLHTITVIKNVALLLAETRGANVRTETLVNDALERIGQGGIAAWPEDDATVLAAIAAVNKALGRK